MRSLFTLNECARVRVEKRDFTVFVCVLFVMIHVMECTVYGTKTYHYARKQQLLAGTVRRTRIKNSP
jgi:hypothetical protein